MSFASTCLSMFCVPLEMYCWRYNWLLERSCDCQLGFGFRHTRTVVGEFGVENLENRKETIYCCRSGDDSIVARFNSRKSRTISNEPKSGDRNKWVIYNCWWFETFWCWIVVTLQICVYWTVDTVNNAEHLFGFIYWICHLFSLFLSNLFI